MTSNRIRANNAGGPLGSDPGLGTTVNFGTAPTTMIPTLTGSQHVVVVLSSPTTFEITHLTAPWTSGQSTGTVVRQAEDAGNWPAVAHPGGNWGCDPTILDSDDGVTSFNTRAGDVTLTKADVTGTGLTAADVGADASGAAATAQTNAETFATGAVGTEATARASADSTLSTAISTETTRAETAEGLAAQKSANLSDLASESTARTNLGLGTAATHAATDFDASGSAAGVQTNLTAEAGTRAAADTANATAITNETTRAEGAESTNATAISTETTRATTAEGLKAAKASNLSDMADAGSSRFNISSPVLSAASCVAIANVSLSTPGATIDGYSLQSNDEVLLTGQTTSSQNGIWIWSGASSALVRPNEFPTAGVVKRGRFCLAINGTGNGGTLWFLAATAAGLTIDTTAQVWTNFLNTSGSEQAIRNNNTLNQMGAPTTALPMNGQKITGQAAGTATGNGAIWDQLPTPTVFNANGTFTPTVSGSYLIEVLGGGGGGAGAGSAAANTTAQVGGAGGGQGEYKKQYQTLVAGTGYSVTIGAGGAVANGGAAGGHPGVAGNAGLSTTFAGVTNLVANGGGSGVLSGASSLTNVEGGSYGNSGAQALLTTTPGSGGFTDSALTAFISAGAAVGLGAGGGGAGGTAGTSATASGGSGGAAGSFSTGGGGIGGALGANTGSSPNGVAGGSAAANTGAGGGGGGGGAGSTGAGGNGGAGGSGLCVVTGPFV